MRWTCYISRNALLSETVRRLKSGNGKGKFSYPCTHHAREMESSRLKIGKGEGTSPTNVHTKHMHYLRSNRFVFVITYN